LVEKEVAETFTQNDYDMVLSNAASLITDYGDERVKSGDELFREAIRQINVFKDQLAALIADLREGKG
jgi:hypothetical protein